MRFIALLLAFSFSFPGPAPAQNFSYSDTVFLGDGQRRAGGVAWRADQHESFPVLSYSERLGPGAIHFSFTQGADDSDQSVLGLSLGRATLSLVDGDASTQSAPATAFVGVERNFFHGQTTSDYTFSGAAFDYQISDRAHVQLGLVNIAAAGYADRKVYHSGLHGTWLSGTVYAVQRESETVGGGLDLTVRLAEVSAHYQELRSISDASWRRAGVGFEVTRSDSLAFNVDWATNPLYEDAGDKRLMVTYRRDLGKRRPAIASAATANTLSATGNQFRALSATATNAALAGAMLSSGSARLDRAARFGSPWKAAYAALSDINPKSVRENREYGGAVYANQDGTFGWAGHVKGTVSSVAFNPFELAPKGTRVRAAYHTHGGPDPRFVNEMFSPADIRASRFWGIDGFLATPAGRFLRYDLRRDTIWQYTINGKPFPIPK